MTDGGVFLRDKRLEKEQTINRALAFYLCLFLIFCGLLVRLGYIQLREGRVLEVSANRQYCNEEDTTNHKYKLLDRKGLSLFQGENKYFAVIDPMVFYTLNDTERFPDMKNISYVIKNYNKEYDITALQDHMEGGRVRYEVDEETYNRIREVQDLKGIYTFQYEYYEDVYDWNIKNVLYHWENYSDHTVLKDEGTIEREIYENVKDNIIDRYRFEEDVSRNIIDVKTESKKDNNNILTTLDGNIQSRIQDILKSEPYNNFKQIGAVLMDCSDGNILAMAQKNDSLSNVNIGVPGGHGFYLGSVFKTVVYAAALENNTVSKEEKFDVKGIFKNSIEKRSSYNINEAYTASSNEAFAQIAWKTGVGNIYKMAASLGLFDKALELQDERCGIMEGYGEEPGENIITNTAIGQTIRVTPLEVLALPTTIVNRGLYIKPAIIDSIVNEEGVVKEYEREKRQVMSKEVADTIKQSMISVVEDSMGTGGNAAVEGIEIGGKTGTSEYLEEEKKCSDGWFAGFFKLNGRYYSMVVFIPQSEDNMGDSKTACSVFKDIVKAIDEEGLL